MVPDTEVVIKTLDIYNRHMSEHDADEVREVDHERKKLQNAIDELLPDIDLIPIASRELMPFGWRKASKGRTVWRIVEEVISQNLEKEAQRLGFQNIVPSPSEVSVYDFKFKFPNLRDSFVNIKSAVSGKRASKDDISKAIRLIEHFEENPESNLFIATFEMDFTTDPGVALRKCTVMPLQWIPDIYVNPSNNGNLQSAYAKHLTSAVKRSRAEFLNKLEEEIQNANRKRRAR